MAPRLIYNPTILRGRGRFPVHLSSCAIALRLREKLHCCLIWQRSQGCRKSQAPKQWQREVEEAFFLRDDFVTTEFLIRFYRVCLSKRTFGLKLTCNWATLNLITHPGLKPEQKQIFRKHFIAFPAHLTQCNISNTEGRYMNRMVVASTWQASRL